MKHGIITAILFASMLTTAPTGMAQEATPTTTPNAQSRATKSLTELQAELDQAEAKVNEFASGLRANTVVSDNLSEQDAELQKRQQLQQLEQAIKAAMDIKLMLQHAQLDEAEARIAASRKLLDERKNQQANIAAQRLKTILSIPPEHASPQAVLDAWEECMIAKDYERFVALLSDDEADRMAGMLIQSMHSMSLMLGLMEQSDADLNDEQTQQIRGILAEVSQYKRANPPPSAVAAMEKVVYILPNLFYQLGATSNGKPLEPPRLTAAEYAALLRQASGILTDSRAFCVAMLKAASAMDEDDDDSHPIPSQWKIEVDGTRAIATQAAVPVDQTTTKTRQVTLVLEHGRWMISQLGSDEELLQAVNGSIATIQQEAPPQDDVINPLSESPPSAEFGLSSPPPSSSGFLPSPPPYYATPESQAEIIKRKMQGRWVVDEIFDGAGKSEADTSREVGELSITITGNVMRYFSGDQELSVPILISTETVPGSKVALFNCHRAPDLNGEKPRNDSTHGANSGADKKESPLGSDNATVDHESTDRFDWNAFLELLPESGSVLVMFDNESDVGKQMLPIVERVTENASVRLIKLPQTDWPGIISPPATRFVLMKDRQLVGTHTGLMTESRLTDFVAKADDWLTPRSTGVSENSLVRIDCYINPGKEKQSYTTHSILRAALDKIDDAGLKEAISSTVQANHAPKENATNLSTPQATLDSMHCYSASNPNSFPAECYTDEAMLEMSGAMLQQVCFMSALSQIGLQQGGLIGTEEGVPIVAGTAPSFHLRVDALLKEQSLATPPEESRKAFELLAKLTLRSTDELLMKPDRELLRLAAGTLKSPEDFLIKAGELMKSAGEGFDNSASDPKESTPPPHYEIAIDGDRAMATLGPEFKSDGTPSIPTSIELQRHGDRWLISQVFSDEELSLMVSSMSQVLDAMQASEPKGTVAPRRSEPTKVGDAATPPSESPPAAAP
ncbi:MAG: hypothetical protein R3C53_27850 [Pirellulaceae bacterium]